MSGTNPSSRYSKMPGTSKILEVEKKIVGNILDKDLTCSICLDTFKKPSVLECKHVFCHKCLNDWLSARRTCPMCRKYVINDPVRCPLLGKLIAEMQDSVSTPNASRRKTMFLPRQNRVKENNNRPPWR